MALIDVISWDGGTNQVAWKFPSSNLRLGSQLVVKPGQTAFFVYRGKVCDQISEGTVTLQTGNIPLLTNVLSIPFGGNSPFQAEVWFVNTLAKLDTKWGTTAPIQVEDARYGIILPIRAYGQYGFRISDATIFLENLLGASQTLNDEQINQYFRGKIISTISSQIGGLLNDRISFLNIAAHLDEVSDVAKHKIAPAMERYGIKLESFYFESINVPQDDPSFIRLKQIKEKAAELNVVGRDIYQLDKSMDVLKTAAGNEGLSGLLMQSGMGSGMGVMMGAQLGQQVGSLMTQVPPTFPAHQYFLAIKEQQLGPFTLAVLQKMQGAGVLTAASMVWRHGMAGWQPAGTLPDLSDLFSSNTPPSFPPPVPPVG